MFDGDERVSDAGGAGRVDALDAGERGGGEHADPEATVGGEALLRGKVVDVGLGDVDGRRREQARRYDEALCAGTQDGGAALRAQLERADQRAVRAGADDELERRVEIELAGGVGVRLSQDPVDLPSTSGPSQRRLGGEPARVAPRLDDLVDPANRFTAIHPSRQFAAPAFEAGGLYIWGFTAILLDAVLGQAGLERPWNTADERTVPARFLRR